MSLTDLDRGRQTAIYGENRPVLLEFVRSRAAGPARPGMTAGRIPGVGDPTFGRQAASGRDQSLVRRAASSAFESLDLIEQRAQEVAFEFRWHRLAAAREGLGALVTGLEALMMFVETAAQAAGVELDAACDEEGLRAVEETRVVLHELVSYQDTADWPALTDALEHDVPAALAGWRDVIESVSRWVMGRGPGGCAA